MKLSVCRYVMVFVLLLICAKRSSATHIYGGDLRYQYVSGTEYKVILTLFGDCSSSYILPFGTYTPRVYVQLGNFITDTVYLREDSTQRKDESPVCNALKDSTACSNPASLLPGGRKFVYTTVITMPPNSNWKLVFDGQIAIQEVNGGRAGRSSGITNIVNPGVQTMYLEATLDNSESNNSSPDFTSSSLPYYCNNVAQSYNLGVSESDGDSVVSYLTPALLNSTATVNYLPGFSSGIPISSNNGGFSYDIHTGQMNFTPNLVQQSVVVFKVEEYKNGKLVGSSIREMTFIVLATCGNSSLIVDIDTSNIIGGVVKMNTVNPGGGSASTVNVCAAEPLLKFEIPTKDKDGNDINIKVDNAPSGAEVKIIDNGTPNPVLKFEWNTSAVEVGAYNLFLSFTVNACPLAVTKTFSYPINIINPTGVLHEVIRPTGCIGNEVSRLILTDGLMPRIVTISNTQGMLLKTYYDTTGAIIDSFRAGKYIVRSKSIYLTCVSEYQYVINDSGYFPIPVIFNDLSVCKNDEVVPIDISPGQGATLHWYDLEGNRLTQRPEYTTDSVKAFNWIVTQQYGSCETKPDTFTVTVHDLPKVEILNTNEPLCTGDSVLLLAKGAVRYNWQPDNWMSQNDTQAWVRVRQPTNFVVTGFTEYNCTNTDTIMMDRLEQCCTFFYPDAFTPNNDGLNDRWAPVTEANADLYLLAIYNRWGERVYYSNNEHDKWDGTHNGRLCDVGTYTYMFRAKCVMGRQETTQGALLLVR